ncbi:MAG: type III-A CRISPR-associated RAMP protein Csm4 [archaeon]
MKLTLFKLKFRTPLHIGDNRPHYESCEGFIHSDTLFSALINAWQLLYPDDLKTFFPEEAPDSVQFPFFRISSAFPFAGRDIFFPKPYIAPQFRESESKPGDAKRFKRLVWIAKPYFEHWLNREEFNIDEKCLSPDKHFLFSTQVDENKSNPLAVQDSPRIVKDRATEQTEIFYYSRLFFAADAGLFFLATFPDKDWKLKFITALNLLGDEGIGGDRSVGHGLFEVAETMENFEIRVPANANHFLTLTLYHPRADERLNLLTRSSYDLTVRSGWVYSGRGLSLRRNAVRMFTEGSVFSGNGENSGDVVKVLEKMPEFKLNHAVFRYGQALGLPILVPEEK